MTKGGSRGRIEGRECRAMVNSTHAEVFGSRDCPPSVWERTLISSHRVTFLREVAADPAHGALWIIGWAKRIPSSKRFRVRFVYLVGFEDFLEEF